MSYRYEEQMQPPAPRRVTDVAITTHEHVYEVDPAKTEGAYNKGVLTVKMSRPESLKPRKVLVKSA